MLSIKRFVFIAAGVLIAACSFNETPELSTLKLSQTEVAAGDTITGTATVEDDDADLSGGKMIVKVSAEGALTDTRELPIDIGDDSASKASVSISMQISNKAPKGVATVELVVQDKAGHKSNAQTAPLTIK